jgi:hypothetical protein
VERPDARVMTARCGQPGQRERCSQRGQYSHYSQPGQRERCGQYSHCSQYSHYSQRSQRERGGAHGRTGRGPSCPTRQAGRSPGFPASLTNDAAVVSGAPGVVTAETVL